MRQRVIAGLLPLFKPASYSASEVECQVAKFSSQLLSKLRCDFSAIDIPALYRVHLARQGYLTRNGHIRRIELMKKFSCFIDNYSNNESQFLPRSLLDYRYFSQLLEPNGSHHPFRHLLFSCWLFGKPDEMFIIAHDFVEPKHSISVRDMKIGINMKCLRLLKENCSLNKISQLTGKSRCYLKRIGALNNIEMKLSPKKETKELHKKVIEMAFSGFHRRKIAEVCNISLGLAEQIISSQPGLVEHRKKCHFESKRRRYRAEIMSFIRKFPNSIQKNIRIHCNKQFFWLYRNDHDWMLNILPKPTKSRGRYNK
jgi:hypothetical protein